MKLKGIILDVDGTIADTEEIHRQAFNQTFKEYELDWHWSVDDYRNLLSISGGKERFKKCLKEDSALQKEVKNPGQFILEMHSRKSEHYRDMIANGKLQLRPGIIRLINEARDNGILLGIATSSSSANLTTLINTTLHIEPEALFDTIVTCDTVSDKKPSPVVYQCALAGLGLNADVCVAIEDTRNGNLAALSAELHTIITTHSYTLDSDFTGASMVLDHLGEPNKPFSLLSGIQTTQSFVDIALLEQVVSENGEAAFDENLQQKATSIN